MKAVEISLIDLGVAGELVVEKLALALEDGTILGDSWLATFLRGDVLRRGPLNLADLERRYSNGYFGAALVNVDDALTDWEAFKNFKEKLAEQRIPFFEKARVYVPTEGEVPEGSVAEHGKRGGIYYETKPHFKAGDLVMIHGGRYDGEIGNVEESPPGVQGTLVTIRSPYGDFSRVFDKPPYGDTDAKLIVMQRGYAQAMAQRREARKRREKRAKEIADSIGRQADKGNPLPLTFVRNDYWSVPQPGGDYPYPVSIYKTDTGLEVVAPVPGDDAEKAPSLESVETAISQMPPDAVNDLKAFTQRIVLSPVPHARDAELGKNFVASGTMSFETRTLTLYPGLKENPHGIAGVMTHEVGHAVDAFREAVSSAWRDAWYKAWEKLEVQGTKMPAHPKRMREVEEREGIPEDPNSWTAGWSDYAAIQRAMYNKDTPVWMPDPTGERVFGEMRWHDLDEQTKAAMLEYRDSIAPVTKYAERNEKEYYAEAYEKYRYGRLPSSHAMYTHFTELGRIWPWLLKQRK